MVRPSPKRLSASRTGRSGGAFFCSDSCSSPTPGAGTITVNDRPVETYFARPVLRMILQQPLQVANRSGQYDIVVSVMGGGLSGQAGAVRHGLAKALTHYEPELRGPLKKEGFLTRDARVVERKKYGRKKARRSFQFSKR